MTLRAPFTLVAAAVLAAALAGCGGPPAALPTPPPDSVVVTAEGTSFVTAHITAPAGEAFTLFLENKDHEPHNVHIWDAAGQSVYSGPVVNGPNALPESVPALAAGTYRFSCDIHPGMSGELVVE